MFDNSIVLLFDVDSTFSYCPSEHTRLPLMDKIELQTIYKKDKVILVDLRVNRSANKAPI